MKRRIYLTQRQVQSLDKPWSPASGLSKADHAEIAAANAKGSVIIYPSTFTDYEIELDSSLEARQKSWDFMQRHVQRYGDHIVCDKLVVIVQSVKRLHPLCWALWVHDQITATQALKWGNKSTFTPTGAKKAIPITQGGISDCGYGEWPYEHPCINPNHYLLHVPGEEAPKVFSFEWGDLAPWAKKSKTASRETLVIPRFAHHLSFNQLPPGVEPKDEPASDTDPLPAHIKWSEHRRVGAPWDWDLFLGAPVVPKDPDNPTDYEHDRMQAWEEQELLKAGGFEQERLNHLASIEVEERSRRLNSVRLLEGK